MKLTLRLVLAALVLAAWSAPALADGEFVLHYRLENLSNTETNRSGMLLVEAFNASGEDIQELVAWIQGPNNVTYDNRRVIIGDLADGQQRQVLDPFVVPIELTENDSSDEEPTWNLEYTNSLGETVTVEVVGQAVP